MSDANSLPQKPTFYGRRNGRPYSPKRQEVIDRLKPLYCLDLPTVPHPNSLDPKEFFDRDVKEVWLEVGFGGGEHLAWQAEHNPDVGIIGCEPFMNGVGSLLRHIDERNLTNVRILADDARPLLDGLHAETLTRAFVLFADPWPKKRHENRRFIGPDNLPKLSRLLKDNGELRLASDDPQLIAWEMEHTIRHPDFDWTAKEPNDWRIRPDDWPQTRYEEKAIKQGRTPVFMSFKRLKRETNSES